MLTRRGTTTPSGPSADLSSRLTAKAHEIQNGDNGNDGHKVKRIRDLYTRVTYRGMETVVDNAQKRYENAMKASSEAIDENLSQALEAYAKANLEVARTGAIARNLMEKFL